MRGFFSKVRAMPTLCFSPPDSFNPRSPTLASYPSGSDITKSWILACREQVEQAARQAKIHDFVVSLPDGYNAKVGERGLKLSGGEKQRVGIARTLLKNPRILILDEATSALDTQTERDIQDSLLEMEQGRSVIIIAHRLSTIADADLIVVLEAGQVSEQGTHEQLLALGGRYAAMWEHQSAEDADVSPPLNLPQIEEAKRKVFSARNTDGSWNTLMPTTPG